MKYLIINFFTYFLRTVYSEDINLGSNCIIDQPECDQLLCPKITEITNCSEEGIDGYTTYQISIIIRPNTDVLNIYAIYGDQENEMFIPPVYNIDGPFNSDIGGISPYIISIFPDAKYDSWLTIGITDGDQHNKLSSVGIDFDNWDRGNSILVDNGAIFTMDPLDIINKNKNEYVIGQLTILNDETTSINVNIQGKTNYIGDDITQKDWNKNNIAFNLYPTIKQINPLDNCLLWYDGCNLCPVINGEVQPCASATCLVNGTPECRYYIDDNTGH